MIDIKTQTKRATNWQPSIINVNLFCDGFEIGIVTSNAWGDFKAREEPLITLQIEGKDYQMPKSEFIAKLQRLIALKS